MSDEWWSPFKWQKCKYGNENDSRDKYIVNRCGT